MVRTNRIKALVFILAFFTAIASQANPKVYAAMIYQFSVKSVFTSEGDFVIGVLGETPVKSELKNLATQRTIHGRKITIKYFSNADAVTNCDLIYVPKNQTKNVTKISNKAKAFNAMLVTEEAPSSNKDVLNLNFTTDNGRLKFEMNESRLMAHGIRPSADLVRMATML